ncbi:MAG: SAF domain-containing protein [Actinomycetota bacterium]
MSARSAARLLDRHRRLVAALCAAAAVGAMLSVLAPKPAPTETVLTASTDLAAGHALTLRDLRTLALPPAAVPAGALRPGADVIGRAIALPVRRGEVLTDVRLAGSALLTAVTTGGLVGTPVRIADAAAVALLRAGDHVDVLGATEGQQVAAVLASDVLVVSAPDRSPGATDVGLESGALVVLATTPENSRRLAQAAIGARLSIVLRG